MSAALDIVRLTRAGRPVDEVARVYFGLGARFGLDRLRIADGSVMPKVTTGNTMAPCVIMIDELEKALSGVGSTGDSGVSSRMFGTLLTYLSDHESDVFIVASANGDPPLGFLKTPLTTASM